jgi:hypothetical protein
MFAELKQNKDQVIVTFNGVPKNNVDTEKYMMQLDRVFAQKKKFRIIYDTRNIGNIGLSHILAQAKYMNKRKDQTQKYMQCCAVLGSDQTKVLLKILFKFKKPSVKHFYVSTNMDKIKAFMKNPQSFRK